MDYVQLYVRVHKIHASLKEFEQGKQRELDSEVLKDRKYQLYLFYKHFCPEEDKQLCNSENAQEKFLETIHENDEAKFIENLLESPLSRFGI